MVWVNAFLIKSRSLIAARMTHTDTTCEVEPSNPSLTASVRVPRYSGRRWTGPKNFDTRFLPWSVQDLTPKVQTFIIKHSATGCLGSFLFARSLLLWRWDYATCGVGTPTQTLNHPLTAGLRCFQRLARLCSGPHTVRRRRGRMSTVKANLPFHL